MPGHGLRWTRPSARAPVGAAPPNPEFRARTLGARTLVRARLGADDMPDIDDSLLDDDLDDDDELDSWPVHTQKLNTQRVAHKAFADAVEQCGSTIVRGRLERREEPMRVWHRRHHPKEMALIKRDHIALAPEKCKIYDRSVIVRECVTGIPRRASPLCFAHFKGAIPSDKVGEFGSALLRIMKTYTSNFYKDAKSKLPSGLWELAVGARLSSASTAEGPACGVSSYEWARDLLSGNIEAEKDVHMLCDIVLAYYRIFKFHNPEEYLQIKYK